MTMLSIPVKFNQQRFSGSGIKKRGCKHSLPFYSVKEPLKLPEYMELTV